MTHYCNGQDRNRYDEAKASKTGKISQIIALGLTANNDLEANKTIAYRAMVQLFPELASGVEGAWIFMENDDVIPVMLNTSLYFSPQNNLPYLSLGIGHTLVHHGNDELVWVSDYETKGKWCGKVGIEQSVQLSEKSSIVLGLSYFVLNHAISYNMLNGWNTEKIYYTESHKTERLVFHIGYSF